MRFSIGIRTFSVKRKFHYYKSSNPTGFINHVTKMKLRYYISFFSVILKLVFRISRRPEILLSSSQYYEYKFRSFGHKKKEKEPCLSYFLMSSHWILFALRITPRIRVHLLPLVQFTSADLYLKSDWNKNVQESFFIFNVPEIKISEPIVVVDWNRDENNDIVYIYIHILYPARIRVSCPSLEYSLLSPTVHINAHTFIVH